MIENCYNRHFSISFMYVTTTLTSRSPGNVSLLGVKGQTSVSQSCKWYNNRRIRRTTTRKTQDQSSVIVNHFTLFFLIKWKTQTANQFFNLLTLFLVLAMQFLLTGWQTCLTLMSNFCCKYLKTFLLIRSLLGCQ